MGFAKYHEDNVRIMDERMYDKMYDSTPFYHTYKTPSYKYKCQFCDQRFVTDAEYCKHIIDTHFHQEGAFVVNGKIIEKQETKFDKIYNIALLYYGNDTMEGTIYFGGEEVIKTTLDSHNRIVYLTDILSKYIANKLELKLVLGNKTSKYTISQRLEILNVTEEGIKNKSYKPEYFYEDVSNGLFEIRQNRIFMSMLAHSGDYESVEMLLDRVEVEKDRDKPEDIIDFYLYYYLVTQIKEQYHVKKHCDKSTLEAMDVFESIMNLDKKAIKSFVDKTTKCTSQTEIGCMLLCLYLLDDIPAIHFYEKMYTGQGILHDILGVVKCLREEKIEDFIEFAKHVKFTFEPFADLPFIKALKNILNAVILGETLGNESYEIFNTISPIVCIVKSQQSVDGVIGEKILKSAMKRFDKCEWLLEYASCQDYKWLKNRVSLKMPNLYRKYIEEQNKNLKQPFSKTFLQEFDISKEITVSALGNPQLIGGSCYVVQIDGYNIMLDCGLIPKRQGEEAYPKFESVAVGIDAIIITHAHVDHSGAIAKAHSLWPNAPIFTTTETKAMLEPILNDISHSSTEASIELETVEIERVVAVDTFASILTVKHLQWVRLSDTAKFRLHEAGHLLGAAMIELVINNKTVLYTGDICMHSQELVRGAQMFYLPRNPDLLICESTYMGQADDKNWLEQREALQSAIVREINRNRVVLLPCTSIGKSQELLCIVGEMIKNGELPEDTPIYIGGFARNTCASLVECLNDNYKGIIDKAIPYTTEEKPPKKSIIIASSASMKKGTASYYIAKNIHSMHPHGLAILTSGGVSDDMSKMNLCKIEDYPLSIHAMQDEIIDFVRHVEPKSVAFVHWGNASTEKKKSILDKCRDMFGGDIVTMLFENERPVHVNDIKTWIEKEIQ